MELFQWKRENYANIADPDRTKVSCSDYLATTCCHIGLIVDVSIITQHARANYPQRSPTKPESAEADL